MRINETTFRTDGFGAHARDWRIICSLDRCAIWHASTSRRDSYVSPRGVKISTVGFCVTAIRHCTFTG